jgi:hypothetical protein
VSGCLVGEFQLDGLGDFVGESLWLFDDWCLHFLNSVFFDGCIGG